jgi:hypothetical protein
MALGVDRAAPALADPSHLGDPTVEDSHVGPQARRPGPVYDNTVVDD